MAHSKARVASVLGSLDLGSSVAEEDDLLEAARVETSVFGDLLRDRVDLIPGTKGSGKSALYRIFVEFLAADLYRHRKVVVAHGVQSHGDSVFMAFKDRFDELTEGEFVDFWCIYLVSLAHEHFIKGFQYRDSLTLCAPGVTAFRRACLAAKIPEVTATKSLRDILEWVLNALPRPKRVTINATTGTLTLDLVPDETQVQPEPMSPLPRYIDDVKDALNEILECADLQLWLMIDRLDEIFPRRSETETRALRGLLRAMRVFQTKRIRVKVFLRDDILEQVTEPGGFTALTHITARQADTLRWGEDQILTLITNRLFASDDLCAYLNVARDKLAVNQRYREESFYRVFAPHVYSPPNQSATLRWIYSHTQDGRGVSTPRDVIDLLTRAKQWQQDDFKADPGGTTDWLIGGPAVRYGLTELSKRKRDTLLKAELPHLWPHIERFVGGKTEYSARALRQLLGARSKDIVADLLSVGFFAPSRRAGEMTYRIPSLYKDGLGLSQGFAE